MDTKAMDRNEDVNAVAAGAAAEAAAEEAAQLERLDPEEVEAVAEVTEENLVHERIAPDEPDALEVGRRLHGEAAEEE